MPASDVVVIGGGIMGCGIAWRLAHEGVKVTLVEREQPGAQASSAAAGLLQPEAGRFGGGPLLDHWMAGLRMYPEYVGLLQEETAMPFEYRIVGRMYVALDESELPALEERHRLQQDAGVRCDWWTVDQARQAEPALSPTVAGAVYFPDHGMVDNRMLVQCAAMAAVRRGVTLLTGRPVTGLLVEGDRVVGVDVCGERIAAGTVVNAAGCWSGQVDRHVTVPVKPAKGQILALESRPPICHHVVSSSDGSIHVRANGRTVVGATIEDAGYDRRVTASGMKAMLDCATRLFPSMAEAAVLETWTGLRPRVPMDDLPVIGAGTLRGLLYATGHFSMGILSAPATAEAVTGLVVDGKSPLPIEAFSPLRFVGGEEIHA